MKVYFDNAAGTALDPKVFEAMHPYMTKMFGNPSSIHGYGREAKSGIEKSRKLIADLLNTSPSEIFFTSGGTEADNTAIRCAVRDLEITHCITSKIEHHAVLHSIQFLEKVGKIKVSYIDLDEKGHIDYDHLESLLKCSKEKKLVSLMHANNEIGNITDLEKVGNLCEEYDAIFHSDTVQAMSRYKHDLQQLKTQFIVGAAHKFHGPKGVGFLYIKNSAKIKPFIYGGAQERNMRGGTENVYGIIGLAKAMEIAYENMDNHRAHIQSLKDRMIAGLQKNIQDVQFNGDSLNAENSLYTVLNVSLAESKINDMLLFNLDIAKISASGGSACASGSALGSHVLTALNHDPKRAAVRFSFSKNNTIEEVDYVVGKLVDLYR